MGANAREICKDQHEAQSERERQTIAAETKSVRRAHGTVQKRNSN